METQPHQAVAKGRNLRVSWKDSTEIGRFIKGDNVEKAERKLEKVIDEELPVPYTKFNSDAGHKPGQGPGKFPVNASKEMLQVLKSAKKNAENEGLNVDNLEVQNVIVNQGPRFATPGRQRGRKIKSAHINVVVGER